VTRCPFSEILFSVKNDHHHRDEPSLFVIPFAQVNFHPHSKEPPLFEDATHVDVDPNTRVTLKDLR